MQGLSSVDPIHVFLAALNPDLPVIMFAPHDSLSIARKLDPDKPRFLHKVSLIQDDERRAGNPDVETQHP